MATITRFAPTHEILAPPIRGTILFGIMRFCEPAATIPLKASEQSKIEVTPALLGFVGITDLSAIPKARVRPELDPYLVSDRAVEEIARNPKANVMRRSWPTDYPRTAGKPMRP